MKCGKYFQSFSERYRTLEPQFVTLDIRGKTYNDKQAEHS